MKKIVVLLLVLCMFSSLFINVSATSALLSPISITYVLDNATSGLADGTVTVTLPKNHGAKELYMFWADDNGKLEGYTSLARFEVQGTVSTHRMADNTIIPEGATKLIVYSATSKNVLSESYAETTLPDGSDYDLSQQPLAELQVVSDIHIGTTTEGEERIPLHDKRFKAMLEDIVSVSPNSLGVFTVGDNVDRGYEYEYLRFWDIYNSVENAPEIFMGIGDHEPINFSDYTEMVAMFNKYSFLPDGSNTSGLNYDIWVGGYHFIFLGTENTSNMKGYITLSDETIAWLDDALAENRDATRPSFIFMHKGLENTVAGLFDAQGWHGVTKLTENKLRQVLKKYPEATMWNGHSHENLNSYGAMKERDAELPTIFSTASVGYTTIHYDSATSGTYFGGSQGYYVEIYQDKLLVRGRDFATNEWISSAQFFVDYSEEAVSDKDYEVPETEPIRDSENHFEVNKSVFLEGDPILITALQGSGSNWIAIGQKGAYTPILYYTIAKADKETVDIRDTTQSYVKINKADLANLPSGDYVIKWIDSGSYSNNTGEYSVDIKILANGDGVAQAKRLRPVLKGCSFEFSDENANTSSGTASVYLPGLHGADKILLYWADQNGKVGGENALVAEFDVKATDYTIKHTITNGATRPLTATKMLVYTYSEQFGLSADCDVIELSEMTNPITVMGDVNGNTVVDTTDLALLKKYLADKENEDADQVINGNVDGEGEIDTTDLAILKKILANIYEAEKPSIDYEDPDVWTPPVGGEGSETPKIDYEDPDVWTPPKGGEN